MAEFIPVYDTQTEQYGMYDTVGETFRGNLGTGDFIGGTTIEAGVPCTNAPNNAHYTGSGIDNNNCPWKCDSGYGLTIMDTCEELCPFGTTFHIGDKTVNVYKNRPSVPSLNFGFLQGICYVRLVPGNQSGMMHMEIDETVYHTSD